MGARHGALSFFEVFNLLEANMMDFEELSSPNVRRHLRQLMKPGYRRPEFDHIFQIKVTFTEPPVWRRLQVPETYTLWDLYVAISDALHSWECHNLVKFSFQNRDGFTTTTVEVRTWEKLIKDYMSVQNPSAVGQLANWTMSLELETVLDRSPGRKYPSCVDGAGVWDDVDFFACLKEDEEDLDRRANSEVVFDDPDEMWLWKHCEDSLLHDWFVEEKHTKRLARGRYPIMLPVRCRDLFMSLELISDSWQIGPMKNHLDLEVVEVRLRKSDLDELVRKVQDRLAGILDLRLKRAPGSLRLLAHADGRGFGGKLVPRPRRLK